MTTTGARKSTSMPAATTTAATTAAATTTRLQIDWTRCDGHGLCAAILPAAVTRDDWGYPVIDARAADRAPVSAVRRAVSACPALALHAGTTPGRAGAARGLRQPRR